MTLPAATYIDHPQWGLHLVGAQDPQFLDLLPNFDGAVHVPETIDSHRSAILVNDSGKAIVVLGYIWVYTCVDGSKPIARHSDLGSSTQLNVLFGIRPVMRDLWSFILPGSRRLITEGGTFGDNRSALRPEELPPENSRTVVGHSGHHSQSWRSAVESLVLDLDFVVFEDGLCVGQDRSGMFDEIADLLRQMRHLSSEAVRLLRSGAARGVIFDLVRPMAARRPVPASSLRSIFSHGAIHALSDKTDDELIRWFDAYAQADPPFHRSPAS